MSKHMVTVDWIKSTNALHPETYSRNHTVQVNGPQAISVSASAEYKGDPSCADPEQMLVSALASCHMLFFLAFAEMKGFRVERYTDNALGHLEKGADGLLSIARIELRPVVSFSGDKRPNETDLQRLHSSAHKNCFIANSLKSRVVVSACVPE